MTQNPSEFYHKQITQLNNQKKLQKAKARNLSLIRMIAFLAIACFLYVYYLHKDWIWIVFSIATFGFFLRLVSQYTDLQNNILFVEKLIFINENELQTLDNQASNLYDGNDQTNQHSFDYDLNVFGKFSIFHQINRTGFLLGTERLVRLLKEPFLDQASILLYQNITKELTNKVIFRQAVLANGLLIEEIEQSSFKKLLIQKSNKQDFLGIYWKYGNVIWSILAILIICLGVYFSSFKLVFGFWLLGLTITGMNTKKVSKLHQNISNQKNTFTNLLQVFDLIEKERFENDYLQNHQKQAIEAKNAILELTKIVGKFDQRQNMIASALLNGFSLYDIHCVKILIHWQEKYQTNLPTWFALLAEMEVFNSIANFSYNHPNFVVPYVTQTKKNTPFFEAKALGHPLISDKKRISNDIKLGPEKNIFLLTGANMSGKSTFLRSIGANLLLAQIGATVCAIEMKFSPLKIQTSLHQTDSLEENKSYFYAELERIQRITQIATTEKSLILLDEVLRGTNSEDKRNGTSLLIKRFMKENSLTIIATHDVELGLMENEFSDKMENLCFESQIINDELVFDYQLRKGVAQNKNATFLMEKMNIV